MILSTNYVLRKRNYVGICQTIICEAIKVCFYYIIVLLEIKNALTYLGTKHYMPQHIKENFKKTGLVRCLCFEKNMKWSASYENICEYVSLLTVFERVVAMVNNVCKL